MSEYEDQADYNNVICPYCKYEYQPEPEDYSEDTREKNCEECGKKFYLHQSFSVSHLTDPDCELNGQQHKWEEHELRGGRKYDFCSVCGKCRPFSIEGE